ncbi:MAG: SIMPL domain-containing protein [Anaerolineae bacterium]|nr:SIMPL domain-containing protein [Anaerolineae bacterium]
MRRSMRNVMVAAGALLVAVLVMQAAAPARAQDSGTPDRRTITVNGVGTVSISPDTAYIRVGVDVVNAALSEALSSARTGMEAVMAALTGAGIAPEDIQTDQYTVFREDRFEPTTNTSANVFRVINIVRVTVRNVDQVADVLNAAVDAGANAINSVEFGVADVRPTESSARTLALDDARARAAELAAAVGGTLGEVLTIQETGGFVPFDQFARGMGGGGGAGPVSPGSLQVSVSLVVTFALQ